MSDEEDWDDDLPDEEYIELESPIEPPADLGDEDEDLLSSGAVLPPPLKPASQLHTRPAKKKKMTKDKRLTKLDWPESLPYPTESLQDFDRRLDFIQKRLVQCVLTRDYDIGLSQWTNRLQFLMSLKYPMRTHTRASLARLYYNIVLMPGCHPRVMDLCAGQAITLLTPQRLITQKDITLPWKPLFHLLLEQLFPKARATGLTSVSQTLLSLAETAQRFFAPEDAEAMLEEMLPRLDGSNINGPICMQSFLVHFLPLSQPQSWLPTLFRLWDTFNSIYFDEQMLDLLARLCKFHTDPATLDATSDDDDDDAEDSQPASTDDIPLDTDDHLWKDVGLLTSDQFAMVMTKALRIASLPVGVGDRLTGAKALTHRHGAFDSAISTGTLNVKKPSNAVASLATIIVYSISKDGPESPSTGHTTPATPTSGQRTPAGAVPAKTFLAGSRALDAFARYLQATESYFHPSNHGHWSTTLNSFVSEIAALFYLRWQDERHKYCKTPSAKRLTPKIKREFVLAARNVCLVALFGKDGASIAHSQKALKRMALLEPDLIMDHFLSRAYEDLENLETSHRTNSVLSALSALCHPLVSKDLYPKGPSSLPELFIRCLPAIDPTDHLKTLTTCAFLSTVTSTLRLDDLTRPELFDSLEQGDREPFPGLTSDDDDTRRKAEEALAIDDAIRFSTNAYEEWCISFLDRVFLVCKSMPEEGGSRGKTGEKQEEAMIRALMSAVTGFAESLSPHLFKRAFEHVVQHCAEEPSANSVRTIGSLIGCLSRIDPGYTLDRMVPLVNERIRAEISNGAGSRRTTQTHTSAPADMRLHWYLSSLIGSINGGKDILKHRDTLLSLAHLLTERTLSERSYSFSARLVNRLVNRLCSIYPKGSHPLNPDEWTDPKIERNAHRAWGKMYQARDVQYQWHVPDQDELDFAFQIVKDVVMPAVVQLEEMQSVHVEHRDKVWSNDFCRRLTLVRSTYHAMAGLIMESDEGGGEVASDSGGQECAEFIAPSPRWMSGFVLTDPSTPHYQFVVHFRSKVGAMLYHCASASRTSEAEDKQDCTKLLIRTIRSYMTEYSYSSADYHHHLQVFSYFKILYKLYPRQQDMPRLFWYRRAAYYHSLRGRNNSFFRRRTELDDKLIKEVILEYCMSSYVGVRKTAQQALESIASRYDGTRSICMPSLIDAIKPNVDDDRMKGALYVLGQKNFAYLAATDSRLTAPYILCLLNAHHHPKPSLQKMVRMLLSDFVTRLVEPSSLRFNLENPPALLEAVEQIQKTLPKDITQQDESALLEKVTAARASRMESIQQLHTQFMPEVLAVAQDPTRHWSILHYATRILRPLIRKDQPPSPELTAFFAQGVLSSDKTLQGQHTAALAKALYYIKLRSLAKSDTDLVRGKSKNPLKKKEQLKLPVPDGFTEQLSREFFSSGEASGWKMRDRTCLGWLVWGAEEEYYELPPRTEAAYKWEEASLPAIEALRSFVTDRRWWETLFAHLSQERDRKQGSTDNYHLFKGIFQVFGVSILDQVSPIIEEYVGDNDRHKHRAACEALMGLLRGSKNWPLQSQHRLWAWLTPVLETIFKNTTHDSSAVWEGFLVEVCRDRDPRRVAPLVDFVIQKVTKYLDAGESATESIAVQMRAQTWLGNVILALDRKMEYKAEGLSAAFWKNIDTPYTELRVRILSNLKTLDYFSVAPNHGSTQQYLQISRTAEYTPAWQHTRAKYQQRFSELKALLAETLPERTPISQGTSKYDNVAMYASMTLISICIDWRASPMLEIAIDFLPSVFQMLEFKDNRELTMTAADFLTRITAHHWGPGPLPMKLIRQLISIIEQSQDSWRTRLEALGYLQIAYFENLFYLEPEDVKVVLDMLLEVLTDSRTEVREIACASLSGIVRSSQRQLISDLSKRFTHTVVTSEVPARGQPGYSEAIIRLHSGILGCVALVNAFPYDVPAWMPSLLVNTLCQHTDDPPPVNTTIKNCARDFKRTHQDNWQEQSKAFTSDQLAEVNAWALGRSDYFV